MMKLALKTTRAALICLTTLASVAAADQYSSLKNIPFPTHGGKFIWQDVKVYADWRIQKNLFTGHHRLLDADDIRRVWGSYTDTLIALNNYKSSGNLKPRSSEMVMLIHGITPVVNPFEKIEPALKKQGLDTVKISYPSTLGSIRSHADALAELISRLEGTERIHFVTHSMGALVLRHLLADWEKNRIQQKIGSIVLIAPPNKGAFLAKTLKDFAPYKSIYGQAGQDLSPENAMKIPGLKHPFTIIAGGRNNAYGYNPLIAGDDDGTVAVSETELKGSTHTYVIPATHSQVGNTKYAAEIVSSEIMKKLHK